MKDITIDMIREWIDICNSDLKRLESAKQFVRREYYERDSIGYHLEEDLITMIGNQIRDHKTKKALLEQMLIHSETEIVVEMFPYFMNRIEDKLPENLRKDFGKWVYEI